MRRLVVLGGSTPFAAGLVEALRARVDIPPHLLVLHGRHEGRLRDVGAYAQHRLGGAGWMVQAGTNLGAVLDGADVVVHQIRYGGLDGRAEDERFAYDHGCAPDETLGPGALRCLLRSLPGLRRTGAAIRERSPDAWVVNLTNPLSATTRILADHVGERCLGVCELPEATARETARALGVGFDCLEWSYVGLNHRGFVYDIRVQGEDVLPDLLESVGERGIGGIATESVRALRAVPTKYFRLTSGPGPLYVGRAAEVEAARERLAAELAVDQRRPPRSLGVRPTPWYDDSLVPLLAALSAPEGEAVVATTLEGSGPAYEQRGRLSWTGVVAEAAPPPSPEVARWVQRYSDHEQAVLNLSRLPSHETLRQAVELDPLVPPTRVDSIVTDLSPMLTADRGVT